jgi:hypothetical protein
MSRIKFIAITVSVFIILDLACNLSSTPVGVTATKPEPTVPIETQVAGIVAATEAAQTALANAVASTLAARATNTPEYTFTPSLTPTPSFTPTPTFTFTPSTPKVSVSSNTFCRTGPGEPYDILGTMNVGESAEVIGRNAAGDTWIIRLPSNPAIICWLWGYYATVTGDTSDLTVYTAPPTPTPIPIPDFTITYLQHIQCEMHGLRYQITNNGSATWESISYSAYDSVTALTVSEVSSNSFRDVNYDCMTANDLQDLEPGEWGIVTFGGFPYNPNGHSITATFKLCSLNGLAGNCVNKSITFTP